MKVEIEEYINHLKEKDFRKSTIEDVERNMTLFINYLTSKGLEIETTEYTHLLDWIKELRNDNKTPQNINRKLTVVRQYFDYLNTQKAPFGGLGANPARHLHIKVVVKRPFTSSVIS